MDGCETSLEQLLAAKDAEERRKLLEQYAHCLTVGFFQAFKTLVMQQIREHAQEAQRLTDIAFEAASLAKDPECEAYVWWTQGNVHLFIGNHEDCLAAYTTAIAIFANSGKTDEIAQIQSNCMLPLMYLGRYAEAQAMGKCALQTLGNQGNTKSVANLQLNLGICRLRQGNHSEALAPIRRAADIFLQLDDTVEATRCWITQAVALRYLDRFSDVDRLLRKALHILAEHEAWLPWARAALNMGIVHARLHDHQQALYWLEKSHQAFVDVGIDMDAAIANLYRMQSLLDVNLLAEAAALGDKLVHTFVQLSMPRQVARTASLLGEVYTRLGKYDLAHETLERARYIFENQGDAIEVAFIDVQLAALLLFREQPAAALQRVSKARESLDVHDYPVRHAEASLVLAASCEELGLIEEAQVAYRIAWAAGSHPTHTTEPPAFLAYRVAYARGVIAEAADARLLAKGEYERAVHYLEQITQGLGLDELRGGYLVDKRQVYEAALCMALEDNRLVDAFRISELARAGAMRDAVYCGAYTSSAWLQGEDEELKRLKANWAWLRSFLQHPVDLMSEAQERTVSLSDQATLLRNLKDLERKLADAYRNHRLTDARFAVLVQGIVLGARNVQPYLSESTALLAFDYVGDRLFVFVLTCDEVGIVWLGSRTDLQWETTALNHALEEVLLFDEADDLAMLDNELRENLYDLYKAVLAEPLAQLKSDVRQLWIVPCEGLHALPFEAFYDGEHYVLERYTVCYLASSSLLAAMPEGRTLDLKNRGVMPLIMANSWDGRLPQALTEAEEVVETLVNDSGCSPRLLEEERATAEALRQYSGTATLLHLVTHGTFRANAPLFSSLHLADGPLTVNEVYNLDLSQAALVTLSGCQTGLGQGRGGELLGLAHAFFSAGVSRLVVSRWHVDDAATRDLMRDFYMHLIQGKSVVEALRAAQLHQLRQHPHAYYWASFAVLGRGFDVII